MKNSQKFFILATTFIVGAVILTLEVLGFRLLAPYFGSSVYVSGSLISVILAALSLGYYLGGVLADRNPKPHLPFLIILAASGFLAVIYFSRNLLLEFFQGQSLIFGTLLSTFTIFAPPMTLLSMIPPFMIKLIANEKQLGTTAGQIFSVSTLGSILGSLLATFIFIPHIGTSLTFIFCIILLTILASLGLWTWNKGFLLSNLLLPIFVIKPYFPAEPYLIHQGESPYNLVRIFETKGVRSMVLNRKGITQSYIYLDNQTQKNRRPNYRDLFLLGPVITPVKKVLMLGMSGGVGVKKLLSHYECEMDAVEIDPLVVKMAKNYFGVSASERLKIHITDARRYLFESKAQYDFIIIDLFQGGPDIPFYFTTKEFFTRVLNHLTPTGVVMMNVLGNFKNSKNSLIVEPVTNTFADVFPTVFTLPLTYSTLVIAMKHKMTYPELTKKLSLIPNYLKALTSQSTDRLKMQSFDPTNPVITDDLAPIEQYTYAVLSNIVPKKPQ